MSTSFADFEKATAPCGAWSKKTPSKALVESLLANIESAAERGNAVAADTVPAPKDVSVDMTARVHELEGTLNEVRREREAGREQTRRDVAHIRELKIALDSAKRTVSQLQLHRAEYECVKPRRPLRPASATPCRKDKSSIYNSRNIIGTF